MTDGGGGSLVRYEQARALLRECKAVDEAKDIRDKAEALAAYARQRDDTEAAIWLSEIKLRAVRRIGELSRELETAEPHGRGAVSLPDSGKRKADALAEAGISTSAAQRYEALIGGPSEQGIAAATAATEAYFAQANATREPPTMAGLKTAIDSALTDALGPDVPQRKPKKMRPEAAAFADWSGAVLTLSELNCDLDEIARLYPFADKLLGEAEAALPRLRQWIAVLREVAHVKIVA